MIHGTLWNVSDRGRRTNNNVEGWHSKFNKMVGGRHPNVWRVIQIFQSDERENRNVDAGIRNGMWCAGIPNTFVLKFVFREKYRAGRTNLFQLLHAMSHLQMRI